MILVQMSREPLPPTHLDHRILLQVQAQVLANPPVLSQR